MTSSPVLVAIDYSVLLELAKGHDVSLRALDRLEKTVANCVLIVTETPLEVLSVGIPRTGDAIEVRAASDALKRLRAEWRMKTPRLDEARGERKSNLVRGIFEANLLPWGIANAAGALVEAALHECRMLLTWSGQLLEMPRPGLQVFFQREQLTPSKIISPGEVLRC